MPEIRLNLTQDQYDRYLVVAEEDGLTLEELMLERLESAWFTSKAYLRAQRLNRGERNTSLIEAISGIEQRLSESMPATPGPSISAQLQQLSERIAAIEARLDEQNP